MARANSGNGRAAVAVIGAGIMGSAMARNLVAAGLTTRVWDRAASATGPLADAGAVVAASARDAVRDAGVVITMLPTAGAAGGQALPLLAALSGQWHAAVAAGYGRQDISVARLALASPSPTTEAHNLVQERRAAPHHVVAFGDLTED